MVSAKLGKYVWRLGTFCGVLAMLACLTGCPPNPCANFDSDDGDLCTVDTCELDVDGNPVAVNTPVVCPEDQVCDPATGECIVDLCVDVVCDDGLFCNGLETCDPLTGLCVDGTVPCTEDEFCDEDNDVCVACLVAADCDNGLFCDGDEDCVDGACVDGPAPCDPVAQECDEDNDVCIDLCTSDADCPDDGLFCNGDEFCDIAMGECDSTGDPCGADELCDEMDDECVECLTDADCADDGLFCTGDPACTDGVCGFTGDPCAAGETCDEDLDECVVFACTEDADCDDGLYCNGAETCDLTDPDNPVCVDGDRPCDDTNADGDLITCVEGALEYCAEGDTEAICTLCPTECYLFTLGSDTLTGTAGDDCFVAELEYSPGAGAQVSQLQTGDSANGLAGDDTLDANLNGTNATPTLTGIETLNFSVFDANTTINCTNISGVDTINTVNSTNVLTLASLQENVDFGLTNSSAAAVGTDIMAPTFASSVTVGTADSFALTFDGVTVGMFTVTTQGTSGFESVDMVSSGTTDNILDTFDHAGNTTLLTANFSGAANLQIKNLDPTVLTVDASGMTGNLTLGDGNNTTDGYTDFAVNAMNNITGGEGDDFFIMDNAFTTADFNGATEQIDGGPGTDSLQAQLSSVIGTVFPVTNVENLYLYAQGAASSINLTGVTGLETVTIDHAAGAQNLTLLNIGGSPLPALAYRGDGKQTAQNYDTVFYTATGVGGSSDSLDITVGNRGMALNATGVTNVHTLGALTAPGVEVLSLTVTDGPATMTTGITATTATTLTFTASSNLTVPAIVATAATDTITSINASGVTGNFVCATGTATWANGLSVTLGAGNDQFTLGDNAVAGDTTVITLGEGNDIFTSADTVSADVINGGDGTDTITGGGGDDTISGGTGVDSFVLNYSNAGADVDVIADFDTGAAGDQIDLDVSALQTAGTSGINALATQFTDLQAGVNQTDATAVAIQEITADAAAVAGTNVYVIVGTTAATPAALATLIEVGTHEITGAAAGVAVQDSFIVVYSNGVDAFVAACQVAVDSGGDFVAGDLTAVNLAQISGVTAITAGLFNNANFDFIP